MKLDILQANRELAQENAEWMTQRGIRAFDFLGSIGSGKTMLIEKLSTLLVDRGFNPGVIAGDVAGDDDYQRFRARGLPAINVNTGKECHLEAHLIHHRIEELPEVVDVLFIENVGNLVCPVDFPLGAEKRLVVISVTEGDDMVRKHPVIFGAADIIVINKVDLAGFIEVDPAIIESDARRVNPRASVILTDAKHDLGLTELLELMGFN